MRAARHDARVAAAITLAGIVLSGPVSLANGPVSIAGGVLTALSPGWVMTTAGLALFAVWNLLMVVMLTLAILALRSPREAPPE